MNNKQQQKSEDLAELRQLISEGPRFALQRMEHLADRYPAHFLQFIEELQPQAEKENSGIAYLVYYAKIDRIKQYNSLAYYFVRGPRNAVEGWGYSSYLQKLEPFLDQLAKLN